MPPAFSPILYRDPSWLVVDKPTGMATHAGRPGELGAVEWLELHLGIQALVVSRLDRATSGALLLALDPGASGRAQEIHEQGAALKTYTFFAACGSDAPAPGTPWVCDEPVEGKSARTEFTCLEIVEVPGLPPLAHCRAEITRGRRHQIRRHAAAAGLPLLGDEQYGGHRWDRLALHCSELRWPEIKAPVSAPLPHTLVALTAGRPPHPLDPCHDRRGPWPTAVSDAFRAVHREEIPNLPASLDIYGRWFNAVWYDERMNLAEARTALEPVLEAASATWGLQGGVLRAHRRGPHGQGLVQDRQSVGEAPPRVFTVQEHGLRYRINLLKTQHTGLFLDQRDMRRRIALLAEGKRLANLFAYTCSFSVAAAAERAEVVFSVDTARPCLNTGKENFSINGLTERDIGKFIVQDARKWLARQVRRKREKPREWLPLDLVVCDPPVFASSRDGGKFAVAQEWPGLSRSVAQLLAEDGLAVMANNHRGGDHRRYKDALLADFGEVIEARPPLDFPVRKGLPHHVRIFLCRLPRRD